MDNLRDSILNYSLVDSEIDDKETTLYMGNPQDPPQQPFSPFQPHTPAPSSVLPQPYSP